MHSSDIDNWIENLAQQLSRQLQEEGRDDPLMVGIHTGGVWIAERLRQQMELSSPLGTMDISFYRDDFSRIGMNPQVRPSELPLSVDGRTVILVDDVLYTGRTIRAALNELFDYGRPDRVMLAVLIDRGARELPIQADCVGVQLDLSPSQQVKLCGPEPLRLETNRKD